MMRDVPQTPAVKLLKRVATALGYSYLDYQPDNCLYISNAGETRAWNPLEDDSDAFRLAATAIGTYEIRSWRVLPSGEYRVNVTPADGISGEGVASTLLAATRLAIVHTVICNVQSKCKD